jgi:hypothetical protein
MAEYGILLFASIEDDGEDDGGAAREEHHRYSEEMQHDGTMVAAFALESYTTATTMRGDVITDGPFLESKEVILGFYVVEAPDLDGALEIARRNPIHHQGGGVEVRPIEGWVVPNREHHEH